MAQRYSVQVCQALERLFAEQAVHRPLRVQQYDPGSELEFAMTGVAPASQASVRLAVEKLIGGGFAGQVYRVKVLAVQGQELPGVRPSGVYALKILLPPSRFKTAFRDALYAVGFQAPFSLQVNPAAIRAGAIWQKLIQRAAAARFGSELAVKDIYATFVDAKLGSCGELSEWVEGRQWRLEVNDHLDIRRRFGRDLTVALERAGSPEYLAKRQFMADFVAMLHEMGAPELARQYEWWTCKSQPNVMKRDGTDDEPAAGLTALDFRAGLVLLPFLPMSPGDLKLIGKGLARGSLVQFDRPDMARLKRFIAEHAASFADLADAVAELKQAEHQYRQSLPDVAHHHVRLLHDGQLWRDILGSAVTGWEIRKLIDPPVAQALRPSKLLTLLFAFTGLIGILGAGAGVALVVAALLGKWGWHSLAAGIALILLSPLAGKLARRLAGRGDYRRHYAAMLTNPAYLLRALRARSAEALIDWHRAGRVSDLRAQRLAGSLPRFLAHLGVSPLPAGLHRFLTDAAFARQKASAIFLRPIRLYFDPQAREDWLKDMVEQGRRRGMLSDQEAEAINRQIPEPFIQKYLKSLAVHICLMPVGHLISLAIGVFLALRYGQSIGESLAIAGATVAVFQVTPVSPGSLLRGLYVMYLVLRERNFKDYNIALFLAFFKYVGYLAFPIQMASRYPALAQFMAAHWATQAVHAVPVFGEHGALLEHAAFDFFYNRPLTTRRRVRLRTERRAAQPRRAWVWPVAAVLAAAALTAADAVFLHKFGTLAGKKALWWLVAAAPLLAGYLTAAKSGGASIRRRIVLGLLAGLATGVLHTAGRAALAALGMPEPFAPGGPLSPSMLGMDLLWRGFLSALLGTIAAILEELHVAQRELS